MTSKTLKISALFGAVALLAACKPKVEADLYVGDIYEAMEDEVDIASPITIKLPIQSVDDCEDSRNKILPIMNRHSQTEVKFRSCEELSGEMYDHLIVDTDVLIASADKNGGATFDGVGAIIVGKPSPNLNVYKSYFVLNNSFGPMMQEINEAFLYQDVDVDQINFEIILQNDLREPVQFWSRGYFINESPEYRGKPFQLERRDELRILSSDLTATSLVNDNYVLLGYLASRGEELPDSFKKIDGLFSTTVWRPN